MSGSALMSRGEVRVEAWRAVLEKTDRILSESPVTVSVVDGSGMGEVPAWSDGLNIFLSQQATDKVLGKRDPLAAVLRLKGLNYHELCHVLYTPRMSDDFPKRVLARVDDTNDKTWWYAFNALEDQRIETWFTATYGASRRYFEAIILEWIIREGNAEAAVLIYGRKYLTPRIRVQAGRVFVKKYGKALYDEFKTVIDAYITLELPTQSVKAMNLLIRFHELLQKMQGAHSAPLPPLVVMDNGMHDGAPSRSTAGVARTGRVLVKAARKAAAKATEAIEDAIDADIAEEKRREDGADPGKGGTGKGEPQQGQEDGQGGGQDGPSQRSDQKGGHSESSGGGGAADTGTADHIAKTLKDEMQDLVDEARQDMDEVRNDPQVHEDAGQVFDAIRAAELKRQMDAAGERLKSAVTKTPSAEAVLASRKVHGHLRRIRQEAEPETLRRQHSGRVDVRRLVSRQPHEVDVFTHWDMGAEEETGVEAVVLVDVSGSMNGYTEQSSEATWALKRAFDKLDIRTTVILYDTTHYIVWQPSERAHPTKVPQMASGGGTDPTSALIQAGRILSRSQAPNRVLITVTDGQWGGSSGQQASVMRGLHRMGVVSMLLGFSNAYANYGAHDHLEGHDIQRLSELPKMALRLVARIMRNAAWSA